VANPANGYGYPCWRYDLAQERLGDLVEKEGGLDVEDVTGVLDAIHQETVNGWTIESMVADLTNGMIYLYYFYQYEKPVIIDIQKELANPHNSGALSSLFSEDVRHEADIRYRALLDRGKLCAKIGMSWAALILVSLGLYLFSIRTRSRKTGYVLATIILLGPLALITWYLGVFRKTPAIWGKTLVEVLGDLVPLVMSMVFFLVIVFILPQSQSSWVIQVLLLFGLPLLLGWLLFPGVCLSSGSGEHIRPFLIHRLPHAIVIFIMGLSGYMLVLQTLIIASLRICPLMPFSIWTLFTWLAVLALGALISSVFLFIYEYQMVKEGFLSWSAYLGEGEKVISKSWRQLWGWILISLVVLTALLIIGNFLK
jgi:hypothetical protein